MTRRESPDYPDVVTPQEMAKDPRYRIVHQDGVFYLQVFRVNRNVWAPPSPPNAYTSVDAALSRYKEVRDCRRGWNNRAASRQTPSEISERRFRWD